MIDRAKIGPDKDFALGKIEKDDDRGKECRREGDDADDGSEFHSMFDAHVVTALWALDRRTRNLATAFGAIR